MPPSLWIHFRDQDAHVSLDHRAAVRARRHFYVPNLVRSYITLVTLTLFRYSSKTYLLKIVSIIRPVPNSSTNKLTIQQDNLLTQIGQIDPSSLAKIMQTGTIPHAVITFAVQNHDPLPLSSVTPIKIKAIAYVPREAVGRKMRQLSQGILKMYKTICHLKHNF